MPRYRVLVDGERRARLDGEDDVRAWLARYRDEHADDDPDATHVQVVELRLLGGKLIARETFF